MAFTSTRGKPSISTKDIQSPKIADREDKQAVQKLLAKERYNPIALSAICIGLVSLIALLEVRLRRGLQPAGVLGLDMPMNTESTLGDNVMEMRSQDSNIKVHSSRVGWGQPSSNNSRQQTLCYASVDSILEDIKGLTLVEASDLVSKIEETFGVDASSAPVAMAVAGGGAAGGGEAAAEEKDDFEVVLTEVPADKKIAVLKIVRTITGLGLKEAKTMVESAPVTIKEGAPKDEAADIQKQIEETGGKVELK